jgi:hypothetical protein
VKAPSALGGSGFDYCIATSLKIHGKSFSTIFFWREAASVTLKHEPKLFCMGEAATHQSSRRLSNSLH